MEVRVGDFIFVDIVSWFTGGGRMGSLDGEMVRW